MSMQAVVYVSSRNSLTGKDVWDCTLACGHVETVRRDSGRRRAWTNKCGQTSTAPKRLKCRQCAAKEKQP